MMLDQNGSLQKEMFSFMKIPKAIGVCFLAKTSDNWPIFKVPTNNLLKALHAPTRRPMTKKVMRPALGFCFSNEPEFTDPNQ